MNSLLLISMGILLLLSALSLIKKYKDVKSLSLLGSIFPRIYTIVILIFYLYSEIPPNVVFIHIGILLVFTSDIINSYVERYTSDYTNAKSLISTLNALTELQDKFYLALENAQIGYYIIDKSGKFEYTNKVFSDLTGYSREELNIMSVYDISLPQNHDQIEEMIVAKIDNKVKTTESILRIIRKNKSEFTAKVVGTRTENGHPTITGTIIEWTENFE